MTLWHYLGAFLLGSMVAVLGAVRCALRRRRVWVVAAAVPFVAGGVWIGLVWVGSDWESGFFDQSAWILLAEGSLLVAVWTAGVAAWIACERSVRRSTRGGGHG